MSQSQIILVPYDPSWPIKFEERLVRLTDLVDQGIVTVNVEKTFSLELAEEALDYLKNTPPKGKIVVVF